MTPVARVCVLGLGEAGALIARDLALLPDVEVHGYDPAEVATPAGVVRHGHPEAAVAGADLVLGVTAAVDATTALTQALDAMETAVRRARAREASGALKVSVLPSFTLKWLLPRMGRFRVRHPEIDVMVSSNL
ncbi:MAG: hypothetical protein ACRD0W_06165, partial [Acidimicrobiales bacterium]